MRALGTASRSVCGVSEAQRRKKIWRRATRAGRGRGLPEVASPGGSGARLRLQQGIEKAWEFFIAHFREDLRQAASAMLRGSGQTDDARAEELADSLHAELYGIRSGADGRRKSLFEYFHGRSKLSTWLRAVLAQKHVDLFRTASRMVSLEAEPDGEQPRA